MKTREKARPGRTARPIEHSITIPGALKQGRRGGRSHIRQLEVLFQRMNTRAVVKVVHHPSCPVPSSEGAPAPANSTGEGSPCTCSAVDLVISTPKTVGEFAWARRPSEKG